VYILFVPPPPPTLPHFQAEPVPFSSSPILLKRKHER
jgi:hypothetical protein